MKPLRRGMQEACTSPARSGGFLRSHTGTEEVPALLEYLPRLAELDLSNNPLDQAISAPTFEALPLAPTGTGILQARLPALQQRAASPAPWLLSALPSALWCHYSCPVRAGCQGCLTMPRRSSGALLLWRSASPGMLHSTGPLRIS